MREGACTSFWRRDGWSNGSTTFTRPFCPPIAILHPSTVFLHPSPQAARPTLRHNLPLGVTHPSAFRITVSSCVHRAYFHEPGRLEEAKAAANPFYATSLVASMCYASPSWPGFIKGEARLVSSRFLSRSPYLDLVSSVTKVRIPRCTLS